jgi:PhnB protein
MRRPPWSSTARPSGPQKAHDSRRRPVTSSLRCSSTASSFYVVDENPDAFNLSPEALGGTSVRISLIVDDPDGATVQAIGAGATEVFPVDDQPYGFRQGRVADPFGHHWLIGKPLT